MNISVLSYLRFDGGPRGHIRIHPTAVHTKLSEVLSFCVSLDLFHAIVGFRKIV